MIFKWMNVAYLAIWIFNLLTIYIAKRLDDYDISKVLGNILKYHPFLLIIISIAIMVITCFLSVDTTRTIMGIYFLVTFFDLIITSLFVSLFERYTKTWGVFKYVNLHYDILRNIINIAMIIIQGAEKSAPLLVKIVSSLQQPPSVFRIVSSYLLSNQQRTWQNYPIHI